MGPIRFTLDARQAARRRLLVTMDLALEAAPEPPDPGEARTVELLLPVWTPGSYLVREYARHLSRFRAVDAATSTPLRWHKTAKNRYRIQVPSGTGQVRIQYTAYAHELSVRTAHLTADHAMWNGACVLLWPWDAAAKKPADRSAEVMVQLPAGWELHSQLPARAGDNNATYDATHDSSPVLTADSLDELVDSPCLAGRPVTLGFDALEKPHTLVLDGLCGVEVPENLVEDVGAIVAAAANIFDDKLPYDRYLFLCLFTDHGRGGLEHRSSSLLLAPRTTFHAPKDYENFMGLVAHEHFHVWNIKRMRPADLWHYDYENENYTRLLWVAEGFTAYYDDHLCRRAGVLTSSRYLEIVAKHIADMRRNPGRLDQPLADASFDAWIRLYRPDENTRNVTQSYYGNGALVAMLLDLKIRALTDGEQSLDDAMRALYHRTYLKDRGYTEDDVVACLSQAAGTDLSQLVQDLVHGPLDPDFAAAFEPFGLELVEKPASKNSNKNNSRNKNDSCYLGVQFKSGSSSLASVVLDSPADQAGLAPDDEVLALNGLRVTPGSWTELFAAVARVDEPLTALVSRRGVVREIEVVPGAPPPGEVKIQPCEDSNARQDALRQGWLFDSGSG
ncbi:MAG: M61 family metallopeptidase [Planctomycetota bacterium]